jgi:RNA polymerase sigma factor (sigma-70 family)
MTTTTTAITTAATTATTAATEAATGRRSLSPSTGRLEAAAAGAHLEQLFAEHGRMVLGLCRLLLRDPVEAEDAAQQVFLSAHQALLRGSLPRNAGAWIAAIGRNECRARIHTRMREPLTLPELPSNLPDPLEAAIRTADLDAIWAALGALPRRQRRALLLRELGGLSYHELGRALGMSHSAVESLLFRARQRVRALTAEANARFAAFPVALKVAGAAVSVGVVATGASGLHPIRTPPLPAPPTRVQAHVTSAGPRFVPRVVVPHEVSSVSVRHRHRSHEVEHAEHGGRRGPEPTEPIEASEPIEPISQPHDEARDGPGSAPDEPAQLEATHEGPGDGEALSGSGDDSHGGSDGSSGSDGGSGSDHSGPG